MSVFCFKKLEKNERVNEELKNAREKKNISLDEASRQTRIPLKYLIAIEKCDFFNLPPTGAHRLAYIKKYAGFLGLDEKKIVNKFTKDAGLEDLETIIPNAEPKNLKTGSLFIWARNIAIILLVGLFAGYSVWQIRGVLRPPTLVVYSPPEGFVTASLSVNVEGYTDKETIVTVNGQEIMVGEDGRFKNHTDLSKGINTINIVANKKHGKTTSVVRHIIVK